MRHFSFAVVVTSFQSRFHIYLKEKKIAKFDLDQPITGQWQLIFHNMIIKLIRWYRFSNLLIDSFQLELN